MWNGIAQDFKQFTAFFMEDWSDNFDTDQNFSNKIKYDSY